MIDTSFYIITENTGTVRVYADDVSLKKFPNPTYYDRWMHRHLNDLDAKLRYERAIFEILQTEARPDQPAEPDSPAVDAPVFHPKIYPPITMDAYGRFCAAIMEAPALTAAKCKELHQAA